LLDDGRIHCSGENDLGELGNGQREAHGPSAALGIHDAVEISGGTHHACARLASGTIRCWGYDFYGQLGIGYVYRNYPNGTATPVDVRDFP
jgi:alpha-tubulin suppressor-like RCC1 family protein